MARKSKPKSLVGYLEFKPFPFKIHATSPWQLNLLGEDLVNLQISYVRINPTLLIATPETMVETQKMASASCNLKRVGSLSLSRIDYYKDKEDTSKYVVYDKGIIEKCIKYAVDHNMLEETFIDKSRNSTMISSTLMELCGYYY